MTRKLFYIFAALAVSAAVLLGCNPQDNGNEEEEVDDGTVVPLKASVPVTDNWIYEGRPSLTVKVENPNRRKAVTTTLRLRINTDKGESVASVASEITFKPGIKEDVVLTTDKDLAPGFYKATFSIAQKKGFFKGDDGKDKSTYDMCFGVDPFQIASPPDTVKGFKAFWKAAKEQLAGIDMNPRLTPLAKPISSESRTVYLVEMNSVPDGLGGEPVVVRGYYCEPTDGKPHRVIMHYFGYDDLNPTSKAYCPTGDYSSDAEFYLSTRGQVVNNRPASLREPDGHGDFVNTYDRWFMFGFGNKDEYYYRGAFMDCVQAVRFMSTRPTSDMSRLYAEGSSQGGAFSYAAAALSDIPFSAIAPCVAFMGDFPDYFQIGVWPAEWAREYKDRMSDEEMYEFLSYFDTKNLATLISCPVIACIGLQDETCPPHTNLAPFMNLKTPEADKDLTFFPTTGHQIHPNWPGMWEEFFKKHPANQ